jgi:hypothetical protein
MLPPE